MLFCNPQHDIACYGHVVTDFDPSARTDLILPLAWHDFRVDARNLHPSVQALGQVFIGNWSTDCDSSSCTRVIRSLRSWLTVVRVESKRHCWWNANFTWLHQGVLLFDAIPCVMLFVFL